MRLPVFWILLLENAGGGVLAQCVTGISCVRWANLATGSDKSANSPISELPMDSVSEVVDGFHQSLPKRNCWTPSEHFLCQ